MKNFMKKIIGFMCFIPRKVYYSRKRKRLKNQNCTIISRDCFATFVYHNLGLQYKTPTINLFFSKEDFIVFVSNLKEFLSVELEEVCDSDKTFPVGRLSYEDKSIKVFFMHYKTFEEAKAKWNERKNRVDFSNIYIVSVINKDLTEKDVKDFEALPFKNKLLISNKNEFNSKIVVTHKIFNKKNYCGEFLKFKPPFFCKRYMDDINYIEFLNSK